MPFSKFWDSDAFFDLALPAVTTTLALQLLRVLLPTFLWYLGDTLGVNYTALGLIALGTFLAAFLAEPFRRRLGSRRALCVSTCGVGLMRLLVQVFSIPGLDLVASLIGVVLFTFFVPLYLQRTRVGKSAGTRKFARGILLGLSLDTAIYGAAATLDLAWQNGLVPIILVAILVSAQWWLLARNPAIPDHAADATFGDNLPLAALGPFIFLSMLIFQNVARAITLTGFSPPLALGLILLANAIGMVAALFPIVRERNTSFALFVGAIFLAILSSRPDPQRATADILYFFGSLLMFPFITLIFAGLATKKMRGNTMWSSTIANGIGWFLFALFTFLYYIGYSIRLPLANNYFPLAAMLLIGIAVIASMRRLPTLPAATSWTSVTLAALGLVAPVYLAVSIHPPATAAGLGLPVRVMSYNLHTGFGADGRLDPDEIARTIQSENPDLVGLQEVERGWIVAGNLDLLMYLSQKLQMPYIFAPTADAVWGTAILSRYPIKESGAAPLPPSTLLLRRGYMWALVDLGSDELFVIETHLHQIDADTQIRQLQTPAIMKFWNQRAHTIFLGDLNATPESREVAILRDGGLLDSFAEVGEGNGFTWNSVQPDRRIDYIWHSPDLRVSDFEIPKSLASDHLAIAATIDAKK